jgi:membrane associated rhomboid family serine protease
MAFLQPIPQRQPIFRAPRVVTFLIGFLALAHLARILLPPAAQDGWIDRFAFTPAHLTAGWIAAHGWAAALVPFLTHMAVHNDWTHLIVNALWLLAFGPIVARRLGPFLFLVFFVLCGVAGVATHWLFNLGSPLPVIGASGAISGLMAAGLRLLPTLRPQAGMPNLLPILSRQILLFSLVWVGINILVGVTGLGLMGESGLIAWQAHLGGFIAGLLLVGPFDRLAPPLDLPLEG